MTGRPRYRYGLSTRVAFLSEPKLVGRVGGTAGPAQTAKASRFSQKGPTSGWWLVRSGWRALPRRAEGPGAAAVGRSLQHREGEFAGGRAPGGLLSGHERGRTVGRRPGSGSSSTVTAAQVLLCVGIGGAPSLGSVALLA